MSFMSIVVYMDNREKTERLEKFKKFCQEHDLTRIMKPEKLLIGDYLFHNPETGISVCFEYKTITDFIQSIMDNRVFNQAINMAERYDYHYIILVGDYNLEVSQYYASAKRFGRNPHFTTRMFIGAVTSLNTVSHVLRAPNQNVAFEYMLLQSRKCFQYKRVYRHDNRLPKSVGQYLTCTVSGVSDKTASLVEEELGLTCLSDLLMVGKEDLMSIKGIGESTANKIMESIYDEDY